MQHEVALLAAGCFWGVEEVFRTQPGVISTRVGFTGGHTKDPQYEEVCSDATGHAEAVEVTFDSTVTSYKNILETFFENHNPTCKNYQGPDFGSQYRSAIFVQTQQQRDEAQEVLAMAKKSGKWGGRPVVTEITDATVFYPAEEYHQQYLHKRGIRSCHL